MSQDPSEHDNTIFVIVMHALCNACWDLVLTRAAMLVKHVLSSEFFLRILHRQQTGASNSQAGSISQPEIVRPVEAGLSSNQPGKTLATTLNMGKMASLFQTIVA